jgi:hypothetical protein
LTRVQDMMHFALLLVSGHSAAWLAHLLWEQRVGGSNPSAPTKSFLLLGAEGFEKWRAATQSRAAGCLRFDAVSRANEEGAAIPLPRPKLNLRASGGFFVAKGRGFERSPAQRDDAAYAAPQGSTEPACPAEQGRTQCESVRPSETSQSLCPDQNELPRTSLRFAVFCVSIRIARRSYDSIVPDGCFRLLSLRIRERFTICIN